MPPVDPPAPPAPPAPDSSDDSLQAPAGAALRGPAAADALAAAREQLERAFDADPSVAATTPVAPSEDPGPADGAAYLARAREAGVVPAGAEAALAPLLAERLRTAETPVDARHRAERAIEWALLAARRRGWGAVGGAPGDRRP